MELEWGGSIIRTAKQLHDGLENTILVVRHSERPSLEGLPIEKWISVELTQRGIEAATQFGRALTADRALSSMNVHYWGSKRCQMTADAISIGAKDSGCSVKGPTAIPLKSPISNEKEYHRELSQTHWKIFVSNWLDDSKAQSAMMPVPLYAKDIFRALLKQTQGLGGDGATTIIATHDLHVIPLISYVFRKTQPLIDYLDGIAIKPYQDTIAVSFKEDVRYLPLHEFVE
jgi:hypothetical protein